MWDELLSQARKWLGANKEDLKSLILPAQVEKGVKKRTLSVADIVSDPRVNIGKSWFAELKKRIPLPEADTVKDHGEAWTDGETIIQKIIEYRKENPHKPPVKSTN